jgi:hypothetical protein
LTASTAAVVNSISCDRKEISGLPTFSDMWSTLCWWQHFVLWLTGHS